MSHLVKEEDEESRLVSAAFARMRLRSTRGEMAFWCEDCETVFLLPGDFFQTYTMPHSVWAHVLFHEMTSPHVKGIS